MKRFLLLAVVFVIALPGPVFAAIVYSGSQNVTLTLSPMDPMMTMVSMTFDIAGKTDQQWDDFTVVLSFDGMSHLAIYAPMGMDPMGMGIVGFLDPASGLPFASNLSAGDIIGPDSPLTNVGWAILYNDGVGKFGADGGYIGLMMDIPGGSPHPAWLHVLSISDLSATFDGWAYEDEAGKSIGAGVIPAPAAVILGGFGVGLVAWLRRRRAV